MAKKSCKTVLTGGGGITFAFPDGSKKFPGIKFGSSIVPGLKVVVVTLVDSISGSGIVEFVVVVGFSVDAIQICTNEIT